MIDGDDGLSATSGETEDCGRGAVERSPSRATRGVDILATKTAGTGRICCRGAATHCPKLTSEVGKPRVDGLEND